MNPLRCRLWAPAQLQLPPKRSPHRPAKDVPFLTISPPAWHHVSPNPIHMSSSLLVALIIIWLIPFPNNIPHPVPHFYAQTLISLIALQSNCWSSGHLEFLCNHHHPLIDPETLPVKVHLGWHCSRLRCCCSSCLLQALCFKDTSSAGLLILIDSTLKR